MTDFSSVLSSSNPCYGMSIPRSGQHSLPSSVVPVQQQPVPPSVTSHIPLLHCNGDQSHGHSITHPAVEHTQFMPKSPQQQHIYSDIDTVTKDGIETHECVSYNRNVVRLQVQATAQHNDYLMVLQGQCYDTIGQDNDIDAVNYNSVDYISTADFRQPHESIVMHNQQSAATKRNGKKLQRKRKKQCFDFILGSVAFLSCTFSISVILAFALMTDRSTTDIALTAVRKENDTQNLTYNHSTKLMSQVMKIKQELLSISDTLHQTKETFKMKSIEKQKSIGKLDTLKYRINSFRIATNQLRMQATNTCSALSEQQHITEPVLLENLGEQTCPVNITRGHQLTSLITTGRNNECTVKAGKLCEISGQHSKSCFTYSLADFLEDDKILMDFTCYLTFSNPYVLGPVKGTAAIRQESFIHTTPNQNIFNNITSDNPVNVVGCHCFSLEPTKVSCRYIARFCKYKRGPSNSTMVAK